MVKAKFYVPALTFLAGSVLGYMYSNKRLNPFYITELERALDDFRVTHSELSRENEDLKAEIESMQVDAAADELLFKEAADREKREVEETEREIERTERELEGSDEEAEKAKKERSDYIKSLTFTGDASEALRIYQGNPKGINPNSTKNQTISTESRSIVINDEIPQEGDALEINLYWEREERNEMQTPEESEEEDDVYLGPAVRNTPIEEDYPPVSSSPYQISEEEMFLGEKGYASSTLVYFQGDGVVTDDRDDIVEDVTLLIGEELMKFNNNQEPIVYVRNDRLAIDFEVVRSENKYADEVLGLSDHPAKHRARKPGGDHE